MVQNLQESAPALTGPQGAPVTSPLNAMGSYLDDSHDRPGASLGRDVAARVEAIVDAAEREARAAERAIDARRRSAEEEVDRYLAAARLRVDAEAAARAAKLEALGGAVRRLTDQLTDATAALNAELRRDEELRAAVPHAPWPEPARHRDAAPGPRTATFDAGPHATRSAAPSDAAGSHAAPPAAPAPPAAAAHEASHPHPTWARTVPAPPPADGPDAAPDGLAVARPHVAAVPDPPEPVAPVETSNAARLVAIEMAVGGASRAEVERHLLSAFGVADAAPLLDDVFGAESQASSTLAWGEP